MSIKNRYQEEKEVPLFKVFVCHSICSIYLSVYLSFFLGGGYVLFASNLL